MDPGTHCSIDERGIVRTLKHEGKSMSQITDLMKCSQKKLFSTCPFSNKEETRGRKRATSHKFEKLLIRLS